MTARVVGAVARHEVRAQVGEAEGQDARAGRWGRMTRGTGSRAFGYEQYEKGTHQPCRTRGRGRHRARAGEALPGL